MTSNTQQYANRNLVSSHNQHSATRVPINRQQFANRSQHANSVQLLGVVHNVGIVQFQQQHNVNRRTHYNQQSPVAYFIQNFLTKSEDYKQRNLTGFWYSLTARKRDRNVTFDEPTLRDLISYTRGAIERLNIDNVSKITCSLVQLGCNEKVCIDNIKNACIRHLSGDQLNVQALINIIRSVGSFKSWDTNFINSVKAAIFKNVDKINNISGKDIASLLWSLASFRISYKNDRNLIEAIKNIVHHKINNIDFFNIKDLVSIAWAFAKFEYPMNGNNRVFINEINTVIMKGIDAGQIVDDSELFKFMWSLAKFKCNDRHLIDYLQNAMYNVLQRENHYDGHTLSKIMWASSMLRRNESLQEALENAVYAKLRDRSHFSALDYSNMLWGVERYKRFGRDNFLSTIYKSLLDNLQRKDFLEDKGAIYSIAMVLIKLNCKNKTLMNGISNAICECLKNNKYCNSRDFSNIALFFANYGYKSENTFINYMDVLGNSLRRNLPFYNYDIVYIAWSLVMLKKAGEFTDITNYLLKEIGDRFKNSQFYGELLQLLVQIREILLIEEKGIQIPWDQNLISALENAKRNNFTKHTHSPDRDTVIKTIDKLYHGQVYVRKANSYVVGFNFDVTLEIGNRKIAIKVEDDSTLVQRNLTILRVLRHDDWEVLSLPENFRYLRIRQKISCIKSRLNEVNLIDDLQQDFEGLSFQEDGGQYSGEVGQQTGMVPYAQFMQVQSREANYQSFTPMPSYPSHQPVYYYDHTIQQHVPYLVPVTPVVEHPAMPRDFPQTANQQFGRSPYTTRMYPVPHFSSFQQDEGKE